MEACATSQFWAREIAALGQDVRLIPPAYVKPYVKRQKNDAADAEAICAAVIRSSELILRRFNAISELVVRIAAAAINSVMPPNSVFHHLK
jgi:transposase